MAVRVPAEAARDKFDVSQTGGAHFVMWSINNEDRNWNHPYLQR